MSRVRRKMITTSALISRRLATMDFVTELVYWRIHLASDNFGTMRGEAWDVMQLALSGKSGITETLVQEAIDELVEVGLLQRWEITEGKDSGLWIHLLNHDKHQSYEFIRKRGKRLSPLPPNMLEDQTMCGGRTEGVPTTGTDASEPFTYQRRMQAASSTSTSTSTSTKEGDSSTKFEGENPPPTFPEKMKPVMEIVEGFMIPGEEYLWHEALIRHARTNITPPSVAFNCMMKVAAYATKSITGKLTYSAGWIRFSRDFNYALKDLGLVGDQSASPQSDGPPESLLADIRRIKAAQSEGAA